MAKSKFWNHKVAENIFVLFFPILLENLRKPRRSCPVTLIELFVEDLLPRLSDDFFLVGLHFCFVPFPQ